VINHHTYAIVSDGDLMEGVSAEAASLAGHLQLGKIIFLYDDNKITIEGSTDLAFSEEVQTRFDAYGWHTIKVDGMDVAAVSEAIEEAKKEARPSLIQARTVIGFWPITKVLAQSHERYRPPRPSTKKHWHDMAITIAIYVDRRVDNDDDNETTMIDQ